MIEVTQSIVLDFEIKTVWDIVTSLENYSWRSDLSKLTVMKEGERFVEFDKSGYATTFEITEFKPYERYELNMENGNLSGHWTGIFTEKDGGKTEVCFTEAVEPKKSMMKLLAKPYLKRFQKKYFSDLRNALENK